MIFDNREHSERTILYLILNDNHLLNALQVKPFYFKNKELGKILELAIKSYEQFKIVDIVRMNEMEHFNIDLYSEILLSDLYSTRNSKIEMLGSAEEVLLNYYKQDVILDLNAKLQTKTIEFDKFLDNVKKIDEIKFVKKLEVLTMEEILENINEHKAKIKLKGFDKLNQTLQLVRGDFLVVGATTGVGKSGFLLNLMNSLMDDYQCIYFNMEMSKSTIYKRMVAIRSGIPLEFINNHNEHQGRLINESIEQIHNNKVIVEHKANNIYAIKSIVAKLKNKNKHTILFIDHLGLTRTEDKKSLYEQVTEVAKQLRQICLEYDCTIIAASQLNRGAYVSEEITLNMLKDSGELENSASKIIMLYRDKNESKEVIDPTMYVDIAKNRDGYVGIIKMKYDKSKQIFKELL